MDKTEYQAIIDVVLNALKDKGFKTVNDDGLEYISNGEKAFMIDYDQNSRLINLKAAELKEGEGVEFETLSSWLFENADQKDRTSIANDFAETALSTLGVKKKSNDKIDMPSKKKNSDIMDVEAFTARFLSIYPEHKQAYKDNVATYETFLFDKFFSEFGVKEFKKVLNEGKKRPIERFVGFLNDAYVNGNREVTAIVLYTIIAGALHDDKQLAEKAFDAMEKNTHLKTASKSILQILSNEANMKKYL